LELKGSLPNDIIKKIETVDKANINKAEQANKTGQQNKANQYDQQNKANKANQSGQQNQSEMDSNYKESGRVYIFPSVRKF